jgi:hypothetical protein
MTTVRTDKMSGGRIREKGREGDKGTKGITERKQEDDG